MDLQTDKPRAPRGGGDTSPRSLFHNLFPTKDGTPGANLKAIVEQKMDITLSDDSGNLPLQILISNRMLATPDENELSLIRALLEKGINVNHQNNVGDTALHLACRRFADVEQVIEILLEYGADPNLTNKHKQTPLRSAITLRNERRIKQLLESGAIVSLEDIEAAKHLSPPIKQMLSDPPMILGETLKAILLDLATLKKKEGWAKLDPEQKALLGRIPKLITTIDILHNQKEGYRQLLGRTRSEQFGKKETKKTKKAQKVSTTSQVTEDLLSKKDWELLLTVAETQAFTKDTQIVFRGMYSKYLYVVKKGQVRVEKDGRLIATIGETEIFGEMSLVDRYGTASASVLAHTDVVELYAIEAPFIYKLLLSDSTNLLLRFFRYIAMILSLRLRVWTPPAPKSPAPVSGSQISEKAPEKEKSGGLANVTAVASKPLEKIAHVAAAHSFSSLLTGNSNSSPSSSSSSPSTSSSSSEGSIKSVDPKSSFAILDPGAGMEDAPSTRFVCGMPVLKTCPCSFKKGAIKYNGTMTITKQTILLEAKLFSHKVKENIDFDCIKSISRKEKKQVLIVTNDKRQYSLYPKNCAEIVVVLEGISRGAKESKQPTSSTSPATTTENRVSEEQFMGLEHRTESEVSQQQNALRLTSSDWEDILKGAKSVTYKKDEVLVQAGVEYNNIYQISKGSCRIEKQTQAGAVKLGLMHKDEVFGEISFLERTEASASVIAESPHVDAYIIEGRYLDLLFRENPALGGRFYFYLCTLIGERLHQRHKHYHETEREVSIKDIVEKPLHLDLPKRRTVQLKPNAKLHASLVGPPDQQTNDPNEITDVNLYRHRVCARAISTYPYDSVMNRRVGDPICDQYCVQIYQHRIIAALADGCNWGPIVREAASKASKAFVSYIAGHNSEITDIQNAGELIIRGFSIAHNAIIEGKDPTSTPVGTTTLFGGILAELPPDGPSTAPYGFVFGSVGDCKAFHYSIKTGKLVDLTSNSRQDSLDPTDCGGRLGPYIDGLLPDLRNFRLGYGDCHPNDLLFVVTDGVHDNLDAAQLGLEPKDFGFSFKNWNDIKTPQERSMLEAALDSHRNKLLSELIAKADKKIPASVTSTLLNYCLQTNKKAQDWMSQNPGKKLPSNYVEYPGKMDHTTCITIRVPSSKSLVAAPTIAAST